MKAQDLFEQITIYDNRVESATARRVADGRYEVRLDLRAAKIHASAVATSSSEFAKENVPPAPQAPR